MRVLYILRVGFVSLEALVLFSAWFAFSYFGDELQTFATSLALNTEIVKYLMSLPVVLAAWVINETRVLLQEDKETIQILTAWPDYWKLKVHTWVSLIYAFLFAFMSLMPWVTKSGIDTGAGFLLFLASVTGQFSLAISVYAARIRVKELIAHVKVP